MSAVKNPELISVDDYLAGELISPIKHEYLGGFVYAMAGARNRHNQIASNCIIAVGSRLRGKRCRAFDSDTKIRIRFPTHIRFYYPDVSVVCRPNPQTDSFQDEPAAIFEVISRRTRRTDESEKKDAYQTIQSLSVYGLVEQDAPAVTLFRRTEHGFVREVHQGLEAVLKLPEIEVDLPLAEIYDGVEFAPEPPDEEER